MTIDSGWMQILKMGNPMAFTKNCPIIPKVVFIDGQIKLMKSDAIKTWESFIRCQFLCTIERAFNLGGNIVVLGFDDYTHVPVAKNMTQRKRVQDVKVLEFTVDQELPSFIPDNWYGAIRNRYFKTKVIGKVIRELKFLYQDETKKTVIIDFMGMPTILGKKIELPDVFQKDELKRGECDIKAFAWAGLGDLLIESTDGDFMPLSTLQSFESNHRIILHRMKTNLKSDTKITGEKRKREYEYVCADKVKNFIDAEMNTDLSEGSEAKQPKHKAAKHSVNNFACMVAAAGCDFTMNLPQIGPTKLWRFRTIASKIDLTTDTGLLKFMVLIMTEQYKKHIPNKSHIEQQAHKAQTAKEVVDVYKLVVKNLKKNSKIAERTREAMWNEDRMHAHVLNVLWTVQYWTKLHHYPDPMSKNFGFEKKGNVYVFKAT